MHPFAPPERKHLKALWDAYFEASGMPVLTVSPERLRTLREMDRRQIKPDDIRAVIGWIRGKISSGTKGFTGSSLMWKNAMDVATMEERAGMMKQWRGRQKGAAREARAREPRAVRRETAEGAVNRLEEGPQDGADPARLRESVKAAAEKFRDEILRRRDG